MVLTDAEQSIVKELEFDANIVDHVKGACDKAIERLETTDFIANAKKPAPGISLKVRDGNEAEEVINAIRPLLAPDGYRAFWSVRREVNGMKSSDEVAILKTTDPYAMIMLRQSDGANYGISTLDIIDRLSAWRAICDLDVVGASSDWVALQFSRLPEKICAFAEEVYVFCPDTVEQGVGFFVKEAREPQRFIEARRLCPDISPEVHRRSDAQLEHFAATLAPEELETIRAMMKSVAEHSTPTEMGVRLLAHDILTRKYLFLWWD